MHSKNQSKTCPRDCFGANIIVDEAGTYKFQLYISYEGNNKVVITKQ